MKRILLQSVPPLVAAVLAIGWWLMQRPGISLDEVPMRTETFVTGTYAVGVFAGMALALAISRLRPTWAMALAALLLVCQLLFWPARFSQTSWVGYVVLLPLVAIVSRRIAPGQRRRALVGVLAGAVAVAALLTVPPLSMSGVDGTIYGKPWSIEPSVAENIAVWVVVIAGLAAAAWAVGRPRAGRIAAAGDHRAPVSAGAADEAFSALTPREQETFLLVAQGKSNAEIAQHLFITEATVKTHVGSLLSKLHLASRSGLIAYAYDRGILRPRYVPAAEGA